MKVELSERAQKTVESLIEEGTYPSPEAAVEAALARLQDDDWAGVDMEALARQENATRAHGTFREADEAYVAEIRAKAQAVIEAKRAR